MFINIEYNNFFSFSSSGGHGGTILYEYRLSILGPKKFFNLIWK